MRIVVLSMALVIVCCISFALVVGCGSNTSVSDGGYYLISDPIQEKSHRFEKICIENHVYYTQYAYSWALITPKLDDSGKPVKCSAR